MKKDNTNQKKKQLPLEISLLIQEFAKPITKPDWRFGSPHSDILKEEIIRLGYHHFSWTHMTLASFLISHDLMKRSIFDLDNEKDYLFWRSIIIYTEKQFIDNGYYLS